MTDPPVPKRPERRERRTPAGPKGSIRWIRSILGRPLGLQRRPDGLHVTLLDRRRPPEVVQAASMARLREELRTRLLDLEDRQLTHLMRHLIAVHDLLGYRGWAGVQAMKSVDLRHAIVQTQMLVEREPSDRLGRFIDRLRIMQAAAEVREERLQNHARALAAGDALHVSEATPEEFEASQRDWEATLPAALDEPSSVSPALPAPDTPHAPAGSPAAQG